MRLFQRNKIQRNHLVLDIGTEAVKALIFCKQGTRIVIEAAATQYLSSGEDTIKEAVFKAIEDVGKQTTKKPESLLLELPVSILKARIAKERFQRKKPEEVMSKNEKEEIHQQILKQVRDNVGRDIAAASGILAQEFYFVNFEILETKIDGYLVSPEISGYTGKILEFKILTVFLPKHYLESFQRLFQTMCFKKIILVHKAQGIAAYLSSTVFGSDRVFLDVGGEMTQYFLVRKGRLDQVGEFCLGGKNFSDAISQILGLQTERAREFKERYARGLLSEPARGRVREILASVLHDWSEALKLKLIQGVEEIIVFGGSSSLPEIQEAIEAIAGPNVKTYSPKDFKEIEIKTDVLLNSSIYTNCLFLCCYAQKNF